MADFEIMENPEYTEQIRKFEPTDPAHADLFNSVTEKMINNEAFLKKELDKQGTGTQEQFQQQYEQLTGYTDQKIAQLIDGAPETLDTLKEVADAIAENETVVEALNEAIGKKMDKSEALSQTGDSKDNYTTFTSEDNASPSSWTDVSVLGSGERHSSIFNKLSIMFKNIRWLYKKLGTTDISGLGGGTVTGAISKLNTDLSSHATAISNLAPGYGGMYHTGSGFMTISNANLNKIPIDGGSGNDCIRYNSSLNRLEILKDGCYAFMGSVTISATGSANNVKTLQIYKSGVDIGYYAQTRCISTAPWQTLSTPLFSNQFNAGNYLELYFKDESGSATIGHTYLTVIKVG